MGSREIWNLKYRQGFAFVGMKGKQKANENRRKDRADEVFVTQVF